MDSTSPTATPKPSAHTLGTRKVDQLLAHYYVNHAHPANERIHWISTPLNMLSLLGMLYATSPWLAYAFIACSLMYYARLSLEFFMAMTVVSLLMMAVVMAFNTLDVLWVASFSAFAVAWFLQDYGHQIEGRKPSIREDIQYFWVGHLFVLSKLFFKWGIRW